MRKLVLPVVLLAVVAAGCGSDEEAAAPSTTTALSTTTASGAAPATTSASLATTAGARASGEVVAALQANGLPISDVVEVTAASDKNQLLGRPGGYTSKTTFSDTTIDVATVTDSTPGSVELGGSVGVFTDMAGAQARADYIAKVTAGTPALTEYDYVAGSALLRLSRALTPDQAQAYKTAF